MRDLLEELFADSLLTPRITFEADDLHTARGLASAGLAIPLLPSYTAVGETVQLRIDHPAAIPVIGSVTRCEVLIPSQAAFAGFPADDGPLVEAGAVGPHARIAD